MVLRAAYLVLLHSIPKERVINADHTGLMLVQARGNSWFTDPTAGADRSVAHHTEKAQFTAVLGCAGLQRTRRPPS